MFRTCPGCRILHPLAICLFFVSPAHAGDGLVTKGSRAPACVRGDCQAGPPRAVQLPGALLQAAALSVALGSGHGQMSQHRMKDLPRRSKARLPHWYKRAQAAQARHLVAPAEKMHSASVQSGARTRVREAGPSPVTAQPRNRPGSARAAVSAVASESARIMRTARAGSQARGARHRRLVQDSLEQSFETEDKRIQAGAGPVADAALTVITLSRLSDRIRLAATHLQVL